MANLSKSLTHGLLAVASVGAILTLSEAAKAFTVAQVTAPGFTHIVGDKSFSDFAVNGLPADDLITINSTLLNGERLYQVNYFGPNGPTSVPGNWSYKVTILSGFSNVFDRARTDASGSPTYQKILGATGLSTPLVFNSGGANPVGNFSPNLKTITVNSSWSFSGGSLNSFSDQFYQSPLEPAPVPEPLTILGTGVVLGALPALKKEYAKRKKKKDGNA